LLKGEYNLPDEAENDGADEAAGEITLSAGAGCDFDGAAGA
jgi:hypothetical protein